MTPEQLREAIGKRRDGLTPDLLATMLFDPIVRVRADYSDNGLREAAERVRDTTPESWLGITGPLTDEQQRDLEKYCEYVSFARHTVDIDRRPMSFEDEARPARWRLYLFLMLIGAAFGACFGRWVLPHWVGP